MRASLLELLRFPACGGQLELKSNQVPNPSEVVEGELGCTICRRLFPVHRRIPNLLTDDLLEDYKKREMQGWVDLWRKKGMFDRPTLEDSFRLPYLGGIWQEVSRMFDLAIKEMRLNGGEVILDVGAGQGWASRYFAEKGCRVVAIDIVDDEWYGLGRSWAIMEHAGVYFEPVLADGERLPFAPATFDLVFFCGALHHFRDFGKVLCEVKRVLKPGGRLIATGEPSVPVITAERAVQAQLEEVEEGIVERRPKVFEYHHRLLQAGLINIQIDVYETYGASAAQQRAWVLRVRRAVVQHVRLRFKPLVWLALTLVSLLPAAWAARLTLYLNGGNLFIRAVKAATGRTR